MMQDKVKNSEVKVGYVKHIGEPHSPRCSVQDPENPNRHWVLKPGTQSGVLSLDDSSAMYHWIKGHHNLRFILVSSKIKTAGDSGAPAAKPATTVSPRYIERQKEKIAAKQAKKPKATGDIEGLPTPKEMLESKSPKEILEPKAPPPEEEPVDTEAEDIDPEPSQEAAEDVETEPVEEEPEPDEDVYEYIGSLDYEAVQKLAEINEIDLGRTSTLNGALNKVYTHLEEHGEEGFVTIPAD